MIESTSLKIRCGIKNKKRRYFYFFFLLFYASHAMPFWVIGDSTTVIESGYPEKWRQYYSWNITINLSGELNLACYKVNNCYIVYGEQFNAGGFTTYTQIPKLATHYQYLSDIFNSGTPTLRFNGKSYDPAVQIFPKDYPCINLGYIIGSGSPLPIQDSVCRGSGTPPPPPVSCTLNAQTLTLLHPELSAAELAGNRQDVSFRVSCNRSATVKLSVNGLSNSRLSLQNNGSLYTTLNINGAPAGTGITLNGVGNNGTQVNISSTLGVNGNVQAGKYSASSILILTIL